jgi:hypothetical protein
MIDDITKGIATILWGGSWADHVEEHQCRNLSGCQIEECMPEIPTEAWIMAGEVLGHVAQANGKNIYQLLSAACKADGVEYPPGDEYQERFGECLAYMATGAGVSWFDDHATFKIKVPNFEEYDLRVLADETCEDDGYPACPECCAYNEEGTLKCGNCSEELPVENATA